MKKTLITLTTLAIATTMINLNNINNTILAKKYDDKLNNNLINQINFTFSDQSNDNNYFKKTSTFTILKNWNNYANSWEEFSKLYPTFNFDQESLTSVNMSTGWDDNDYNSSTGDSWLTNTNNINTNDNNVVIIPSSNWKWSSKKMVTTIIVNIWHDNQNIRGKTTFSIYGEGWNKLVYFKLNSITFNNK